MSSNALVAVNPISEQTIKNHLPVSRHAVSDTGVVLAIVPDRRQPRLYQIVSMDPSGDLRAAGSFSMEKLQNVDISADASVVAAATDDDLYVFSEGSKTRLFADRRDIYTGLCLTPSGANLVVSSADFMRSTHSITLLSVTGSSVWVKDVPFSVNGVKVSADCKRILAVSDDGPAIMIDDKRKVVWRLDSSDPITAADVSANGERALIGFKSGQLRMVGDSGEPVWVSHRTEPITACAVNANGDLSIVASGLLLEVLGDDGTVLAEYDVSTPFQSVALSTEEGFIALSCVGGVLQVLELALDGGRTQSQHKMELLRDRAVSARVDGDLASEVADLTAYLELRPSDVEACRELATASQGLVDKLLKDAERLSEEGQTAASAFALNQAQALIPHERISKVRSTLIDRVLSDITELIESGRLEEAFLKSREAVGIDYLDCRLREILAKAEDKLASHYADEAEKALESGHTNHAASLLEKAVETKPSDELVKQLAKAKALVSYEEGLALYEAKKFSQAVFRFRKALSLDPDLTDAQKYIDYSEGLSRQDDMISDRFTKLE